MAGGTSAGGGVGAATTGTSGRASAGGGGATHGGTGAGASAGPRSPSRLRYALDNGAGRGSAGSPQLGAGGGGRGCGGGGGSGAGSGDGCGSAGRFLSVEHVDGQNAVGQVGCGLPRVLLPWGALQLRSSLCVHTHRPVTPHAQEEVRINHVVVDEARREADLDVGIIREVRAAA